MKNKREINRSIDECREQREQHMGWNPSSQLMRVKIDGWIEALHWVLDK